MITGEETVAAGGFFGRYHDLLVNVENAGVKGFVLPHGGIGEIDVGSEIKQLAAGFPKDPAFVCNGGERGEVDDLLNGRRSVRDRFFRGLGAKSIAEAFEEGWVGKVVLIPGAEEVIAYFVHLDLHDGAVCRG